MLPPPSPICRQYERKNQILLLFDESCRRGYSAVAFNAANPHIETALFERPKNSHDDCSHHGDEKKECDLESLEVNNVLKLMLGGEDKDSTQDDKCGNDETRETNELQELVRRRSNNLVEKRYKRERDSHLSGCENLPINQVSYRDTTGIDNPAAETDSFCTESGICENIINVCSGKWYTNVCPRTDTYEKLHLERMDLDDVRESDEERKAPELDDRNERSSIIRHNSSQSRNMSHRKYSIRNRYNNQSDEFSCEEKKDVMSPKYSPRPTICSIPNARQTETSFIPISSLTQCVIENFQLLQNQRKVAIYHLNTYQGKYPESTNGCTVIAPLLAIHHFHHKGKKSEMIPDVIIEEVIDSQAPSILPEVRRELGLRHDALIIPSDVHDYLMNQGLLTQEQFVGCCGGDILSKDHLNELMLLLGPNSKNQTKMAATIFFHEHVICVLRTRRGPSEFWYDMIDSLPCERGPQGQLNFRVGVSGNYPGKEPPSALRIRCKTLDSLEATIRWYSCMKFTDENRIFIDSYRWDERNSHFDPRVFQAFVWEEV